MNPEIKFRAQAKANFSNLALVALRQIDYAVRGAIIRAILRTY